MPYGVKPDVLIECVRRYFLAIEEQPALTDEVKQLLRGLYMQIFTPEAQKCIAFEPDQAFVDSRDSRAHLCNGFLIEFGTLLECVREAGHTGPCKLEKAKSEITHENPKLA